MNNNITVLVNGAAGRMGQTTVAAIEAHPTLQLVGQGTQTDDLAQLIKDTQPQVVIDFTTPDVVYHNTNIIIDANVHPIIGTSGLKPEEIITLQKKCNTKQLGGIIAPNFSLGVILMMKAGQLLAKHFPHMEIIELHHPGKLDAPSGTAIKTAQLLAQARGQETLSTKACKEILPGALGAQCENIPIHSVRLPGLVAHQEILFGGHHETTSIRHDSLSRESFMPGVCFACETVITLKHLYYGLEQLID